MSLTGDGEEPAHSLLVEALTHRKVQPDEVLGALLYLEDLYPGKHAKHGTTITNVK